MNVGNATVTQSERVTDEPKLEEKAPLFLPNRAAYRRLRKGVLSRRNKANVWLYRLGTNEPSEYRDAAIGVFTNIKTGAERDLVTLQEARA